MEPKRIDYQVQSTVKPDRIHMTDYEVFVRTNITSKEVTDENSETTQTIYEYTETVYDKNSYLTKLAQEAELPVAVDKDAMSDQELVAYLKELFNTQCEEALAVGVTVTVPELGDKQFSAKLEDQMNIEALVRGITAETDQIYYHANGDKCRLYSVATFAEITGKIFMCKYQQTTYCNLLKSYVEDEANAESRKTINYGDIPSDDFQTELNQVVLQGITSAVAGFVTPNTTFNEVIAAMISQLSSSN